jgi:hypothetical protein
MDYLRPWLPWVTKEPEPLEARIAWVRRCRAEFDLDKDFVYGIFDKEQCVGSGIFFGYHVPVDNSLSS